LRLAIISDIHSNLEALTAVLKKIEAENIDKIICLGDVVGYGPDPNACVELVQKQCEIIITGNHDFACIDTSELLYFTQYAEKAIEWTLTEISKDNLSLISKFPIDSRIDNCYLVHANAHDPRSWGYVLSREEAIYNFSKFTEQICFIGHSHRPIIYIENNDSNYTVKSNQQIQLDPGSRYIINVGSVGQPRDGNPNSAFGILDVTNQSYELKRVSYDIKKTYEKIMSVGLPQFLAERLFAGR
jgi:predicted phosphodiesterase